MGMTLWQKEERRRLAAAVVYYDVYVLSTPTPQVVGLLSPDTNASTILFLLFLVSFPTSRVVNEILGKAPTLQDVHYTARPPAEVDDRAFSPDTVSVEKVPPVGENAGFCSTYFAMRTRLVQLIKHGDQVVEYARRRDERERMMGIVEGLTKRLTQVQADEAEEAPLPLPHLHTQRAAAGSDASELELFELPTTSASRLAAQHASIQRTVLREWLAGLPGYMTLDESRMFAEEVARTHGGVSAITTTGEKTASASTTATAKKGRMTKNGEACLRHPEMIAQQCELVVLVQSAILRWHLPLLKRETRAWEQVRVIYSYILYRD